VLVLLHVYCWLPNRALHLGEAAAVSFSNSAAGVKMKPLSFPSAIAYNAPECGWMKIGSNEAGDVWEKPNGELYIAKAGIVPVVHVMHEPKEIAPRKCDASLRKLKLT
jgi:hypothetical protein